MAPRRPSQKGTKLEPYPLTITDQKAHVAAVSDRLAAFGKLARAGIDAADEAGDKDTADLFTEISRQIDKDLWMVEGHSQWREWLKAARDLCNDIVRAHHICLSALELAHLEADHDFAVEPRLREIDAAVGVDGVHEPQV
jgi:hypothetical protein